MSLEARLGLRRKIDWFALGFLTLTPVAALLLWSWHSTNIGAGAAHWITFAFFSIACGLSITAGYHRLYAHRTYQASRWVHYILWFFGTASFQGSILKWSSEHRRHHRKIDTDEDPYAITKGFWYAHIGWLFLEEDVRFKDHKEKEKDLLADESIVFQHKNYHWLAFVCGFGAPALVGLIYGDPLGGFLYGGLIRAVFNHHSTFLVNSLAHTLGRKTYSDRISARDSWFVALLTYGEGYHNFHHTFEGDYRNGIKWYQFDPTKWILWTLARIGAVHRLQTTPYTTIFKARIQEQRKQLLSAGVALDNFKHSLEKLEESLNRWRELSAEYARLKASAAGQKRDQLRTHLALQRERIRFEMRLARSVFMKRYNNWRAEIRNSSRSPLGHAANIGS